MYNYPQSWYFHLRYIHSWVGMVIFSLLCLQMLVISCSNTCHSVINYICVIVFYCESACRIIFFYRFSMLTISAMYVGMAVVSVRVLIPNAFYLYLFRNRFHLHLMILPCDMRGCYLNQRHHHSHHPEINYVFKPHGLNFLLFCMTFYSAYFP